MTRLLEGHFGDKIEVEVVGWLIKEGIQDNAKISYSLIQLTSTHSRPAILVSFRMNKNSSAFKSDSLGLPWWSTG